LAAGRLVKARAGGVEEGSASASASAALACAAISSAGPVLAP
jgi:hypothetical protein